MSNVIVSVINLFIITILLLSSSTPCRAQDALIEWLIEHNADFSDQSAALDYLEDLSRNPIAVNTAAVEDFLRLPGITPVQAIKIVAVRKEKGDYTSLEEVCRAADVDENWYNLIAQFLTLAGKKDTYEFEIRQRNQRKFEKSEGFTTGAYQGSPLRNYTRLYLSMPQKTTLGVLIEKDPGEENITDHKTGFLQVQSNNDKAVLIGGYYTLGFAQGLLFSRKSFFGKSQEPIHPVTRRETGGRGYLSSSESEGFLGLFGNYEYRSLSVSIFGAQTKRDARIDESGEIENIIDSGYHRTATERSVQDKLEERLAGIRFRLSPRNNIKIGATAAAFRYKPGIAVEDPDKKLYKFSGSDLQLAGFDFSVIAKNIEIFGEIGFSDPGSRGFVAGMTWSEPDTKIGMLYRDYAHDFYSPFGSSFADKSTEIRNEKGFYIGLKHKFNRYADISMYIDIYKHPWRSFSIPVPENGRDYFAQILISHIRNASFYINWKRRIGLTGRNYLDEYGIMRKYYEPETSDRIRLQGDFQLLQKLRLISRIETRASRSESQNKNFLEAITGNPGLLWSAKMVFDYFPGMRFTVQATLFSSNGTRLYQYEPDLPGFLTLKQFTSKGERFSILISRSWAYAKLSLKYGIVHYPDRSSIGSGLSTVSQNYLQDFGIQWDLIY